MRALVIDDSRAVRLIIAQILREMRMEVVEAGNGQEALERLNENPDVELMLVDWNMPVMNGLDFIRAVRCQRVYDPVRILMVTTETESAQVACALNAGANEYLMKPFTRDVLAAKLTLLDVFQEQRMAKIRVLVVDDAVVFRRLVADELSSDPALAVVGTAANGRIALQKVEQLSPDLVILDIEMPEMDGLATLREVRKTHPHLPVIMFSALTEQGAAATLDALALGASDYFTKPTTAGGLDASLQVLREQLIPRIKALCAARRTAASGSAHAIAPVASRSVRPGMLDVVVIGASTGGPNAVAGIFSSLPADFPVPILIVQHMPPMFTRLLAERLSAEYAVRVQEGSSGTVLQPGRAWIAPGDHHMIVVRDGPQVRLLVHQAAAENSCRPSVDVLLRSTAQAFGGASLTVILTGMGQDGLRGCEAVREAGGQILAQDEATSVVWGMPGFVVRAGLADRVLPLPQIGEEILRRVRRKDRG